MLNRYIWREMIGTFAFGLALFVVLVLSVEALTGVGQLMAQSRHPADMLASYLWGQLPSVLVLTFPMSALLASILVFGRIRSEGELVALQSIGISPQRLMVPALVVCTLAATVALLVGEWWAPAGARLAERALRDSGGLVPMGGFLLQGTPDDSKSIYAFANNEDMTGLTGLYIHFLHNGHRTREIYADSAVWTGNIWLLHNVIEETFEPDGSPTLIRRTRRALLPLPLDLAGIQPGMKPQGTLRAEEMNAVELNRHLRRLQQAGAINPIEVTNLKLAFHQKLALPLSCIIFGLFALPLSLQSSISARGSGVVLTLALLFAYYCVMASGMLLAGSLLLPAALAAWLPNVLFGAWGLYLFLTAGQLPSPPKKLDRGEIPIG